jgi:WD40 repeat protein
LVAPNGQSAYILGQNSSGRLPFVVVFNVSTQTVSTISLTGSSAPLSASLAPDGTLLFVGATDGSVHVIDTASGLDTQQVTFPFPTNELCFSPGRPATQVPLSQVTISAAAQNGGNTTYSYSLTSGPPLKVGENITVSVMSNGANDGTFTITALGTDSSGNPTFTVSNSLGVSAASQSGLGTVPITCNPDLLVVRP